MYAFDTQGPRAGKQAWSFPTKGAVASPVVVGSQVLFGSEDGAFYCVDAERGRQEWRFDTKGKIRKAAARGDGVVIFGSDDQNLYCVPIETD
jgi:outer membrane protein assembly factor BamB